MFKKILGLSLFVFGFSALSYAQPGHVSGKITNITSLSSGLLVRIANNKIPENCTSGSAWMVIKQENTAMISLTLTAWTLGREVVVYTSPSSSGYCEVTQVDPAES